MGLKEKFEGFKKNYSELREMCNLCGYLKSGQEVIVRTFGEEGNLFPILIRGYDSDQIRLTNVSQFIKTMDIPKGERVDVMVSDYRGYLIGNVSLRKHN
jgi:hypothetical protein